MIQKTEWNLGGTTLKSISPFETYPVNELYESERGTKVYSKHATISTDYIGLIYPSDYGYASTDASCRQNLRSGLTNEDGVYIGTPKCTINNWLYKEIRYWVISPNFNSSHHMFNVNERGYLDHLDASGNISVRPSLYLKSNVKIVSGIGTKDNMFKLEI